MRAFLAIKHYDNNDNKDLIENIIKVFKKINIDIFVYAKDIENYQVLDVSPQELIQSAFAEIEKSDILIIEMTEQKVGIGIEACYAYMKNIPVYVIAQKGARIGSTIKGISKKSFVYENVDDLIDFEL